MLIQQKQDGSKGSFYLEEAGTTQAVMTYTVTGANLMIIDHTKVAVELRGKNIGYQLVLSAVEYARANNFKILPQCSFAKSVFDKKGAEFADVLNGN